MCVVMTVRLLPRRKLIAPLPGERQAGWFAERDR
jgi:hypothetical protein